MSSFRRILLLSCLLITASDGLCRAETWTVSGSPYVVSGSYVVPAGDTLTIEPGVEVQIQSTATMTINGTLQAIGTEANPVVFGRFPGHTYAGGIRIIGNDFSLSATGILRHCSFSLMKSPVSPDSPIYAYYSDLEISNCSITDIPVKAMLTRSSRIVVKHNTTDNTGELLNAVECAGIVASNRVSNIIGNADGIDIDAQWVGPGQGSMIVEWNIVENGDNYNSDGIDLSMTSTTHVRYNIVRNFTDKGISVGETTTCPVYNNFISHCNMGIAVKDESAPSLMNNTIVNCVYGINSYKKYYAGGHGNVSNCIVWNCGQSIALDAYSTITIDYSCIQGTTVYPGTDNTTNYPQFINPAEGDFRVGYGPCVNAGANLPWMTGVTDLEGNDRIINSIVDMGAYEFRGFSISIPAEAVEGDGILAGAGALTVFGSSPAPLQVFFSSDDSNEVTVADSITVPAGQTNATFDLTIMDDAYVDGDKTVTITASAGPLSGYDTITVHDDEVPTLSLTIPATAGEGDGPLVGQGMLTVDAIPRGDLTVSLHSDDTTEAQVPSAVIIPGGQTSATFTVTIVDDTEIDGMKNATVTAQSPGWADGYDTINVLDNETTDLRVTVPAQAAEGNGVLTGTVSISGTLANNLSISLNSADTTEAQVPPGTVILSGQTSATFNVTVVDDAAIDGTQPAVITAHVNGWTDGYDTINVLDNETTDLRVTVPAQAAEGDGVLPAAGKVSISGTLTNNLVVSLNSADTTEAQVPSSVTILAGQTSVTFNVTIMNDSILDGPQHVVVSASRPGFSYGNDTITVHDNETAILGVEVPQQAAEGSGILVNQGRVVITDSVAATDVEISLLSDDASEAQVPPTVTILSGQTSATFSVTIVDDAAIDGTQPAVITAHVNGWTDGNDAINVLDNETTSLEVTVPQQAAEGDGVLSSAGTVSISGTLTTNLTVSLDSDATTEAQVPASVTILAGQTSITFNVSVIDDTAIDGTRPAVITAHVNGWTDGNDSINVLDNENTALKVVVPSYALEGDGVLAGAGTVLISGTLTTSLSVSLDSDDTTETQVPTAVTILAGQTSATFNVTIMDDGDSDGRQDVVITAAAGGFTAGYDSIAVQDNEMPELGVILPAAATEGDGALVNQGTVTVVPIQPSNTVVSLSSDDTTEAQVPPTVTILSGQPSAMFTITIMDDTIIDLTQSPAITAHVESWTDGINTIDVLDNENMDLSVIIPGYVTEDDGVLVNAGTVLVAAPMGFGLSVSIASDDTSKITATGTVTIATGQTSAGFDLVVIDDFEHDGLQTVLIEAHADGFVDATGTVDIADNDPHHFDLGLIDSPQTPQVPFSVTITARDATNGTMTLFNADATLTGSGDRGNVPVIPAVTPAFNSGVWTGNVTLQTPDTNVRLTVDDGHGHTGTSNPFDALPGSLDHFQWQVIGANQRVNTPVDVTLMAKDSYNNTVIGYTNPATVAGLKPGTNILSTIVVTECNDNLVDYVEIQNVSGEEIDTSGWVVALNNPQYPTDISNVHTTLWHLPASMPAGQILYRTDNPTNNYFGENIWWGNGTGKGWAIIVDDGGNIVDFAVWGYWGVVIDELDVMINGHHITIGSEWNDNGVPFGGANDRALQRKGNSDEDEPDDFWWIEPSLGVQNTDLAETFSRGEFPVSITPESTTDFVDGVWTGTVTVLEEADDMFIRSDDQDRHDGDSNPFDVLATNAFYRLDLLAVNGMLDVSSGWFLKTSTVPVIASADPYYHFDEWTGDTNGCVVSNEVIDVFMDTDRTVTADFAENLAIHDTPEWWLASYGLTNADWDTEAEYDQDTDGMPAWQEYVAGTDPTLYADCLRITEGCFSDSLTLSWPGVSGRTYTVSTTTDLMSTWTNVTDPAFTGMTCTSSELVFTNYNPTAERRYYRVKVE